MNSPIRTPWVDYLRGFITILVVAHHSSLAYTTFAEFDKDVYVDSTHPVVDSMRWIGLDRFEDFNDIFFMSLMFLIAGIFLMGSVQKKGTGLFIRDRFYRLFIPFIIGVTLLMPLAHYPSYYLSHGDWNLKNYLIDFVTVEGWPAGPPWFLSMLFTFNIIFALSYPKLKSFIERLGTGLNNTKPLRILFIWYALTWITYMPLLLLAGPGMWTGIGPFDFQASRILMYFAYFTLGIIIGSKGINQGLLSNDSSFMKKWPIWVAGSLLTFLLLKLSEAPLTRMHEQKDLPFLPLTLIYRSIWTLSCTFSCIAFITLFKRLFSHASTWWQSLSENAYGIYLVHYIFVLWCQFLLLEVDASAITKFSITFIISVGGSWVITYIVRKNKVIASIL